MEGWMVGWKAENYVPSLFFEKAGDKSNRLKCMFMLFNILLYSQINISLWTNFIFTDNLSIWLVNYRSFYSRLSNILGAAILQLLAHINLS